MLLTNKGHEMSALQDVSAEAAKASPAVAVTSGWLAGVPINSIVAYLTACYVALQIFVLIRDRIIRRGKTSPPSSDGDE